MHIKESLWVGAQLAEIPDARLFPLLDIGSSTREFRTIIQPHLESSIYAPLRVRGGKVWHADIKPADGVDLVGDLLDESYVQRLRELGVRSVMVTNILHHVVERQRLIDNVLSVVPAGGYVIVSGPNRYPKHYDPIDTLFRPNVEALAACFPGTDLVRGEIIDSGNWRQWNKAERGNRSLGRTVARLGLPFYKPAEWWRLARQSPFLVRHMRAVAVVLRKR